MNVGGWLPWNPNVLYGSPIEPNNGPVWEISGIWHFYPYAVEQIYDGVRMTIPANNNLELKIDLCGSDSYWKSVAKFFS